jgi:hypothetical protein
MWRIIDLNLPETFTGILKLAFAKSMLRLETQKLAAAKGKLAAVKASP